MHLTLAQVILTTDGIYYFSFHADKALEVVGSSFYVSLDAPFVFNV